MVQIKAAEPRTAAFSSLMPIVPRTLQSPLPGTWAQGNTKEGLFHVAVPYFCGADRPQRDSGRSAGLDTLLRNDQMISMPNSSVQMDEFLNVMSEGKLFHKKMHPSGACK